MTEPKDQVGTPRPKRPRRSAERIIGGRYRLGPVIGRGGMAIIHRALDIRLDRHVAIKLLRPEISADADLAQRFRREALAATVLRHRNIVACLDTGTDGDQPYLVMDLVDGEDLAARLRRGGRLPPDQVARIGLDVARAIGVAHVRGIVHRDIKPGNVLLAADGRAMVTDFGIARLAVDAESSVPGTTLGSVHYFSPEQARGATTTPASDVYGVGLVMYESLTGQRAWSGDTTDAIALARVDAPAPSPRAIKPEVPADLDAVVVKALAPDPVDRYPNGATIAAALEPIVARTDPAMPTTVVPLAVAAPVSNVAPPLPSSPRSLATSGAGGDVASDSLPRGAVGSATFLPTRPRPSPGRRPSSLVAVLAVLGVIGGAFGVAAASGGNGLAFAPEATETPEGLPATPDPAPEATTPPTPEATPELETTPEPEPTPEPTPVPEGEVASFCEPVLGLACGLGPGRYESTTSGPIFDIELGGGWSVGLRAGDVVSLVRDEGLLTFAVGIRPLDEEGQAIETRGRPRDLIAAFANHDGVESTKPATVRINGQRGRSVDLTPKRSRRVAMFATDDSTYFVEPDRSTRIVALATDAGVLLIAIEPSDGSTLRDILDTADDAAASIRFH